MQPLNYSSWNDNNETASKKRTPTMRKTVKKMSDLNTIDPPSNDLLLENRAYLDEIPSGITKLQNDTNERDQRINQLLETMTSINTDNDGSSLANFTPPPKPEISMKKSSSAEVANYGANVGVGAMSDSPIDFQENDYQLPPSQSILQRQRNMAGVSGSGSYTSVDFDRQSTEYSNYNHIYDPTRVIHKPYYMNSRVSADNHKNMDIHGQLMQKVNYMIHMLEQQEVEKTSNITEEFILYTFLGVFIIYIVDSFSRSGKYIR